MRQKEELFSLTKNRTQTSGAAATEGDHLLNTQEMYARREDEVLSNTSSRLDEYISIGLSTIADLRSQKNSIKSTHRRLMDATASLGVSQSLMRVIGRMSSQERVIFYSGILATLIVIIVLWRYF
jgi:CHASE1-domain containing sensor protein